MAEQDDIEPLYSVPTHLKSHGTIGPFPDRTFYVALGAFVLAGGVAYGGYLRWGWWGCLLGLIPIFIALPFAAWFMDPPPEHGLGKWLRFRFVRKTLQPQHIASLRDLRIDGGVVYVGEGNECRAILQPPTINLDLASTATKRRHRRLYGALLDGQSQYPFQIVLRAEAQSRISAIERMRLHRNPFSRKLADWLEAHHEKKQTIDRRRYIVIPAHDPEILQDRVERITESLKQAGMEPSRLTDPADIRDLLNRWWTWRPHEERLGPERIDRRANELQVDGEWVRVYALGKMPPRIQTGWMRQMLDSDLPCDVSMTFEQKDLALARWRLEMRANDLMTSTLSAGRKIALEQVQALLTGFEGTTRPWDWQCLLTVRATTQKELDRRSGRLEQMIADSGTGAKIRRLTWEQYEGMVSAQPLCLERMPNRSIYTETGTLARSTPFGASTLQMLDGVPWGFSGAASILLTTRGMRTGHHFGWFGTTGSGKGFGVRAYLTRRHFADRLRLMVWDADEAQNEYAGRWCTFMQGIRLIPETLEDMVKLELDPLWQIVVLDATKLPEPDRSRAFALWKTKVQAHVLAFPGDTAFVVDEATTIAEYVDQSGALALGDAVQRWRKMGLEVHVLTQRVSDWFGTRLGSKIQGNLAVKWYGAQEDSEVYDVAQKVKLSAEERDRVSSAGIGQGLLVAFGRRVWSDLYDHASPDEYAAYHTDPPDKVEMINRRDAA